MLGRRAFLTEAAAVVTGAGSLCGIAAPVSSGRAYEKVTLGKTQIVTSRLAFGTGVHSNMRSSGLVRKQGFDGAVKVLQGAYRRGIRCFDLADSYGTHAVAVAALKGVPRADYQLITKYWFSAGGIPEKDHTSVAESITRFLKELKTDYIDVVELHCVSSGRWPEELSDAMSALEKAKKEGKIRAHGCSFHGYAAIERAAEISWLDCCHVQINHKGRSMPTTPARQLAAIRKLHERGVGIIGMKLLGVGTFNSEEIDASLKFVVQSGQVDVLDVGFLEEREIDDLAARLDRIG